MKRSRRLHTASALSIALSCASMLLPLQARAAEGIKLPDCKMAKEVVECALIEFWQFFKEGDKNRDGFIDNTEFMAHPTYKEAGYDLKTKTFIFWMIDDNKDGKVALQEWFNNELGQFQLGDKNHDGLIDDKEYDALVKVQGKLFKDAGLGGQ